MVAYVFDYVIDQAIIHGRLPEGVDRRFQVITPQIWAIDTERETRSLLTAAQALMIAETQGWIDTSEAADSFHFIADQLGIGTTNFKHTQDRPALTKAPKPHDVHRDHVKNLADGLRKMEEERKNGAADTAPSSP